jgi:hypothetical protein
MQHIPKILIKPINAENHRYPTCGDYIYDREDDTLTIFVSRMEDWRSELAVVVHELFEACACLHDDVDFTKIDSFDVNYELERDKGIHPDDAEPGDDKAAPYHRQHVGATFVEKEVCHQLELPWLRHEQIVNES